MHDKTRTLTLLEECPRLSDQCRSSRTLLPTMAYDTNAPSRAWRSAAALARRRIGHGTRRSTQRTKVSLG